ncbi:TPA: hypothetical protein ACH3X2_010237 [Trebouxia sp. C0005]
MPTSDSTAAPAGSQSQAVPNAVQTSTAQAAAPDQLVGVPPTKTRVPIVVPEADATTATAVATADDTIPVGPPEPSPWAQKPQTPPNL